MMWESLEYNLVRTTWPEAMQAVEAILPTIEDYKQNDSQLKSLQSNERFQEIMRRFVENRQRLIEEGKITETKGYFSPDHILKIASDNDQITFEKDLNKIEIDLDNDDEMLNFLVTSVSRGYGSLGDTIMVHDRCYPSISKIYEECIYKDRDPFIVRENELNKAVEEFPVSVFDGDVILINKQTKTILLFHHECWFFEIKG